MWTYLVEVLCDVWRKVHALRDALRKHLCLHVRLGLEELVERRDPCGNCILALVWC
jgi:hypothetical protein